MNLRSFAMGGRRHCLRFVGAALAFSCAATASAQRFDALLQNSPFGESRRIEPTNTTRTESPADGFELRSVIAEGEALYFSLFHVASGRSAWVKLGEAFEGVAVTDYLDSLGVASLSDGPHSFQLALRRATFGPADAATGNAMIARTNQNPAAIRATAQHGRRAIIQARVTTPSTQADTVAITVTRPTSTTVETTQGVRTTGPDKTPTTRPPLFAGRGSNKVNSRIQATSQASTAFGAYNDGGTRKDGTSVDAGTPNAADPIFTIGTGTDSADRRNALTVFRDGTARFEGSVEVKGASGKVVLDAGAVIGTRTIQLPDHDGALLSSSSQLDATLLTGEVPTANLPAVTQLTGDLPWSRVSDTPTTVESYGITNTIPVVRETIGGVEVIASAIRIKPQGDIPMLAP